MRLPRVECDWPHTCVRTCVHTHTVSQVPYHMLNTTCGRLCHPPAAPTGAHCLSTLELRDRGPTEVRRPCGSPVGQWQSWGGLTVHPCHVVQPESSLSAWDRPYCYWLTSERVLSLCRVSPHTAPSFGTQLGGSGEDWLLVSLLKETET